MNEFIKELDSNMDYLEHEMTCDEVIIYVASNRKICRCPYCGTASMRIHNCYEKVFRICQFWAEKQKSLLKTGNSSATMRIVDVEKSTICNLLKKRYTSS